ncbi:uncharacterized protein N7496_011825 [Penicillium cataractarum]|uniref:Zn(2)-C6 fungal-type domain-containing protein n=1 Tax=Penicillium cataractarum TaxID=2100454 RepID=A0A9W9UVZ5_9EURO|nr:uncharacterized protein N7496_011825 [Penicillium cataractarum]KAJ5359412.1 hypothetical protein N7496_011825 [Penicillium cataractarum]
MGPRRSHRKSRNGCPECKSRRLKCDERYPCTNCVKHAIQCSYVAPIDQTDSPVSSVSSATQPQPQAHDTPQAYPPLQPPNYAPTPNGGDPWLYDNSDVRPESENRLEFLGILPNSSLDSPLQKEDWGLDLELMHHYCTVTSNTLSEREDARHVWRVVMPTEGYSNKYLMHGILAIAAVHRAYLYRMSEQRERYIKASAYHLAAGLKEFRELIASPIDPSNWQPVFCFASMISVHLCTVPIRLGVSRWPNPITNTIELFASVKGLQAIMKPFLPSLRKTQLAPLANSVWLESEMRVHSPGAVAQSLLPADIWTQISRLYRFIEEYPFTQTTNQDDTAEKHSEHRKDYEAAIKSYESSVRQLELAGLHVEAGMVFLWAYRLSVQFHKDLEAHHPAALVLLAHYCVLLRSVDHRWYLNDMARQLLEDIERHIHPGYRDWLAWPRRWVHMR